MSENLVGSSFKKVKWIIFSIILLLLIAIYLISQSIKPMVILKNNTDEVIYIFTSQSEYGKEPTLEEMQRWKGVITLESKQQIKLPILLSNLLTDKTMRLDNGWRIGALDAQEKHFTQGFITSTTQGNCETYIHIDNDAFKVIAGDKQYCYKKLASIAPEY